MNKLILTSRTRTRTFNMITRSRAAAFSSLSSSDTIKIIHDPLKRRFYADIHGDVAVLNYDIKNKTIDFYHTEVPSVFRGKGIAKLLATNAFEFAHRENYDVILSCDYLNHSYNSGSQNYPKLKILSQTEQ